MKTLPLLALAIVSLGGCAPLPDHRESGSPVTIQEPDAEARNALRCLGQQLETYFPSEQPPFIIAVGEFKHQGLTYAATPQDLPLDGATVVEAALTQISPLISYTDVLRHPVPAWTLDSLSRPHLFLSGAILIQERVLQTDDASSDVSVTGGSFGIQLSRKRQSSVAGIELDMNATVPRGKRSTYGSSAPLSIRFRRLDGEQTTVALSFADIAVGREKISRRVSSYAQALRLGVAHQVVQLIGRWRALPYWKCLSSQQVDPIVEDERRRDWRRLLSSPNRRLAIGAVQELLAYNGMAVAKTNVLDAPSVAALNKFMARRNERFDPANLESAYWALFVGVADQPPSVIAAGRAWEVRYARMR